MGLTGLGAAIQARYGNAGGYGIIGDRYAREEVVSRSTNVDRTLASAQVRLFAVV